MHTNLFAKKRKLHKFATTNIGNFEKNRLFQTCISIFSKIGLVDQSKPCSQVYLQKYASCINLQLPILILKKSIISDMRHRATYMYINFQQNQNSKSMKTVLTKLFAKNASCINLQLPIVFFLNRLFQTWIIVKRTCILIFSKIGLVDQSKPCTQKMHKFKYYVKLFLLENELTLYCAH